MNKFLVIIIALLSCSVSELSYSPLSPTTVIGLFTNYRVNLTDYELLKFRQHVDVRLPLYIEQFKKYADLHEIPWTLVAAVAYQESKWDHSAVSPTGVRGIMQITEQTAEHIGLNDRKNPHESIRGGAYYLKYLFNKTSADLTDSQRWMQALTAYNIGWGHFRDAYRLSLKLKKDPTDWKDLKAVLPHLENEKFQGHLRYGFARGSEAVDFVESVFEYYILISKSESQYQFIAQL